MLCVKVDRRLLPYCLELPVSFIHRQKASEAKRSVAEAREESKLTGKLLALAGSCRPIFFHSKSRRPNGAPTKLKFGLAMRNKSANLTKSAQSSLDVTVRTDTLDEKTTQKIVVLSKQGDKNGSSNNVCYRWCC